MTTPPNPASLVSGEAGEKLTQMEYLQCNSWNWILPSPTIHLLTVLLK